jgi:hypothetical protein
MLGSIRMKKIAFVLAAAGLMSLAACSKPTPAENNAEAVADNLDAAADNLAAVADNTTNAVAADALDNAADNLHAAADNVTSNM